MSGLSGALCVGRAELFESLDQADHKAAAALCKVCPAIVACRDLARTLLTESATVEYRGIHGTWAGQLHGRRGHKRPKINAPSQVKRGVSNARSRRSGGRIEAPPQGASTPSARADRTTLTKKEAG